MTTKEAPAVVGMSDISYGYLLTSTLLLKMTWPILIKHKITFSTCLVCCWEKRNNNILLYYFVRHWLGPPISSTIMKKKNTKNKNQKRSIEAREGNLSRHDHLRHVCRSRDVTAFKRKLHVTSREPVTSRHAVTSWYKT